MGDFSTGVINSRSASEKSVVIYGFVRLEPRPFGCVARESFPSLEILRHSLSTPLLMELNSCRLHGIFRRSILVLRNLSTIITLFWCLFLSAYVIYNRLIKVHYLMPYCGKGLSVKKIILLISILFASCSSHNTTKEYCIYMCKTKEWDYFFKIFATYGVDRCMESYRIRKGRLVLDFHEKDINYCKRFIERRARKNACCIIQKSKKYPASKLRKCPEEMPE